MRRDAARLLGAAADLITSGLSAQSITRIEAWLRMFIGYLARKSWDHGRTSPRRKDFLDNGVALHFLALVVSPFLVRHSPFLLGIAFTISMFHACRRRPTRSVAERESLQQQGQLISSAVCSKSPSLSSIRACGCSSRGSCGPFPTTPVAPYH